MSIHKLSRPNSLVEEDRISYPKVTTSLVSHLCNAMHLARCIKLFQDIGFVNQPPEISGLNDITLSPEFGTEVIELANFVTDQEGETNTLLLNSFDEFEFHKV